MSTPLGLDKIRHFSETESAKSVPSSEESIASSISFNEFIEQNGLQPRVLFGRAQTVPHASTPLKTSFIPRTPQTDDSSSQSSSYSNSPSSPGLSDRFSDINLSSADHTPIGTSAPPSSFKLKTPLTYVTPQNTSTGDRSMPHSTSSSDVAFMGYVNYFLGDRTLQDALTRAETLSASMDEALKKNEHDTTYLSTKTLCLIVRGEIADFVEVFHRTDPTQVTKVVSICLYALEAAEKTLNERPNDLPALIIKTGMLGLKGQFDYFNPPRDSISANSQRCDVHEETLKAAQQLLTLNNRNLTGLFMKIRALTFQGKTAQLFEALKETRELYPNHPLLQTLIGGYYFESNPKLALEIISQALRLNPKQFLARATQLQLLGILGDMEGFRAAVIEAKAHLSIDNRIIQEIVQEYLPNAEK